MKGHQSALFVTSCSLNSVLELFTFFVLTTDSAAFKVKSGTAVTAG